jgi:hypothetical protein
VESKEANFINRETFINIGFNSFSQELGVEDFEEDFGLLGGFPKEAEKALRVLESRKKVKEEKMKKARMSLDKSINEMFVEELDTTFERLIQNIQNNRRINKRISSLSMINRNHQRFQENILEAVKREEFIDSMIGSFSEDNAIREETVEAKLTIIKFFRNLEKMKEEINKKHKLMIGRKLQELSESGVLEYWRKKINKVLGMLLRD